MSGPNRRRNRPTIDRMQTSPGRKAETSSQRRDRLALLARDARRRLERGDHHAR